MVYQTSGLKKTFKLVDNHIKKAIDSIEKLPPSDARLALVQLAHTLNTYRS
jgi:hexaprenyl-diphosphate synthase